VLVIFAKHVKVWPALQLAR